MRNIPKQRIGWAIVAIVLTLVSLFFGVNYPIPEPPEVLALGTTHLTGLEIIEGGTLAVAGASTFTGAVTASNDLTVDDTFAIDDTDSVITATQTLTPTASFYQFNPNATLTLTLGVGGAEGDFLWLTNVNASNSVVVVDTTATAGGSNRTLGKNDVIGFILSNSLWVEAFFSDNS